MDKIVLLEFPDEAALYFTQCKDRENYSSSDRVISLDPRVQAWLGTRGITSESSISFFTSEAHARALRKSEELLNWLDSKFSIQDELGISASYSNALLWYSRYSINHFLWLSEVLAEVHRKYPEAKIVAPQGSPQGIRTPLIIDDERYLGALAESYCRSVDIPFEYLNLESCGNTVTHSDVSPNTFRIWAFKVSGLLHRFGLRRMGRKRPFFAITHGYRGDALVGEIRETFPSIPWVIRAEHLSAPGKGDLIRRGLAMLTQGFMNNNVNLYMGEIWLRILQESISPDKLFIAKLQNIINDIANAVVENEVSFSHRGVFFGDYMANKLRGGIGSALNYMQREIAAFDQVLDLVQPRMVVTPFGRRSLHALGELAEKKGIPGLLISHGSFSPPLDDLAYMGWRYHSFGLLYGSYRYSALQTPLAERFTNHISSDTQFVRTGPLIWGLKVDRNIGPAVEKHGGADLKVKLIPNNRDHRVVVHAGTPKSSRAQHFHVYETPDEYIDALKDLIWAVENTKDVFLIIKYRPSQLSVKDLEALLPESNRFCISVDESFLDVLAISDLLVSFSSTTIEEAFQNLVPVLLYGGGGRYQHVKATDVVPNIPIKPSAVYSIRSKEFLSDGLVKILDANSKATRPGELFQDLVYKQDEIVPLSEILIDALDYSSNK